MWQTEIPSVHQKFIGQLIQTNPAICKKTVSQHNDSKYNNRWGKTNSKTMYQFQQENLLIGTGIFVCLMLSFG